MASQAEMISVTTTASRFCTESRASHSHPFARADCLGVCVAWDGASMSPNTKLEVFVMCFKSTAS